MDSTTTTDHGSATRRLLIALLTATATVAGACGTGSGGGIEEAATEATPPPNRAVSTANLDGDLAPGTYRTEGYDPNFTFTVREPEPDEHGWRGSMSREESQTIAEDYGLDPELFTGDTRWSIVAETADMPYFELIRLVDPIRKATSWGISILQEGFDGSADEVASSLREKRALTVEETTEPAVLGGAEGVAFDGTAERRGYRVGEIEFALGQRIRHYVLEIDGATHVVVVEAPAEEFEEFLPEAEELLATLRFEVAAG